VSAGRWRALPRGAHALVPSAPLRVWRPGVRAGGIHGDTVDGATLGSVDGDPGVQIGMYVFVGSRAPWDHLGGNAPRFDAFPS
jgi:hypothetical protein